MTTPRRRWPKAANEARGMAIHGLREIVRLADQGEKFAESNNPVAVRLALAKIGRNAVESLMWLESASVEGER